MNIQNELYGLLIQNKHLNAKKVDFLCERLKNAAENGEMTCRKKALTVCCVERTNIKRVNAFNVKPMKVFSNSIV